MMKRLITATNFLSRSGLFALSLGILAAIHPQVTRAENTTGRALSASFVWTGQPAAGQKNGSCVAFRKHFHLDQTNSNVTVRIFADIARASGSFGATRWVTKPARAQR